MKFEIEVNSGEEALELVKFLRSAASNSPAHELALAIESKIVESFDSHVFAERAQTNARNAFLKKQGLDVDMEWLAQAVSTAKLPQLSSHDIEILEEYGYKNYRNMSLAEALSTAETLHGLTAVGAVPVTCVQASDRLGPPNFTEATNEN